MMARKQPPEQMYECPECAGELAVVHRSWRCVDCGFAPNHAAD